jgi:tetratricopeptide (TPR) repeat protein
MFPVHEAKMHIETLDVKETVDGKDENETILDILLREAEEAVRTDDLATAKAIYKVVLRINPSNVVSRMRLGLILKKKKRHFDALEQFSFLCQLVPDYSEAWREKGVVESLIHRLIPKDKLQDWLPNGEESLRKATTLNPYDFDAWASWGGVLRRKPDFREAYEKYQRSSEVSNGHPYPLLNALKLEAMMTGKVDLNNRKQQLIAAEELRKGQSLSNPPVDTPWCYFDLAEMKLYQKDKKGFFRYLEEGIGCSDDWQIETFYNALKETLVDTKINLLGLDEGMEKLEEALPKRKKSKSTFVKEPKRNRK